MNGPRHDDRDPWDDDELVVDEEQLLELLRDVLGAPPESVVRDALDAFEADRGEQRMASSVTGPARFISLCIRRMSQDKD